MFKVTNGVPIRESPYPKDPNIEQDPLIDNKSTTIPLSCTPKNLACAIARSASVSELITDRVAFRLASETLILNLQAS